MRVQRHLICVVAFLSTGSLLSSTNYFFFFAEAQRIRGGSSTTNHAVETGTAVNVPVAQPQETAPDATLAVSETIKGVNSNNKARVTIRRKEDANKPPAHTSEELQQHPMPLQEMTLLVNKQQQPRQDDTVAVAIDPPVVPAFAVGEPNPSAPHEHPHKHHTHLDFERRATHGVEEEEVTKRMEEGNVIGKVESSNELPVDVHQHDENHSSKKLTLKEFLIKFGEDGRKGKRPAGSAAIAGGDGGIGVSVRNEPDKRRDEEREEAKDVSGKKKEEPKQGEGEIRAVGDDRSAAGTVAAGTVKIGGLRGTIQHAEAGAIELEGDIKEATKRLRVAGGGEQQKDEYMKSNAFRERKVGENDEDDGPPGTPRTDRPASGSVEEVRKECTGGMVYSECGRPCTATCEHPRPVCPAVCMPRCHCPSAKPIWNGDTCIEETECHLSNEGEEDGGGAPARSLRGAK